MSPGSESIMRSLVERIELASEASWWRRWCLRRALNFKQGRFQGYDIIQSIRTWQTYWREK